MDRLVVAAPDCLHVWPCGYSQKPLADIEAAGRAWAVPARVGRGAVDLSTPCGVYERADGEEETFIVEERVMFGWSDLLMIIRTRIQIRGPRNNGPFPFAL